MSVAEKIIGKFGGVRPCAEAVGKAPSTVQSWKDSGFIPARHQESVLAAGRERGLDISPADFFDIDNTAEAANG